MSPRRTHDTSTAVLARSIGVFLVLIAWECNARLDLYEVLAPTLPERFFPSLLEIASSALTGMATRSYWAALGLSVGRTLAAFILAATTGVTVAILAARSSLFDNFIRYPLEFLRQLPAVAIIPFAIMVFGIYTSMKVSVAFFGCVFPIFVAAREGLASVDRRLMLTARTYGWTGPRLFFGVMLPAALPQILASFRVVLAISLILIIMSEMLVGGDGLGVRLVEYQRAFDFAGLYAETFLLGCVGVVLNAALMYLNRTMYYWKDEDSWEKLNKTGG